MKKKNVLKKIKNLKLKIRETKTWKYIIIILKTLFVILFLYSTYLIYLMFSDYLIVYMGEILLASLAEIFIVVLIIFTFKKIKSRKNKGLKKNKISFKKMLKERFFKYYLRYIAFIIILTATPVLLLKGYNNFYPNKGYLPLVIFENDGGKRAIFQGMSHLSSSSFFNNIYSLSLNYINNGGVVFYERAPDAGEGNMSKELRDYFEKGPIITSYNLMNTLVKICNDNIISVNSPYLYQNVLWEYYKDIEKKYPNKIISADISDKELSEVFSKALKDKSEYKLQIEKTNIEINNLNKKLKEKFPNGIKNISDGQKELAQEFCYAISRRPVNSYYLKLNDIGGTDFDQYLIANIRNKHLAKKVNEWNGNTIYIVYGVAHLKGFYKELKKLDSSWKKIKIEWIPIGTEKRSFEHDIHFND